jgi:ribosomal-protein-alanine N-acetyltransferase
VLHSSMKILRCILSLLYLAGRSDLHIGYALLPEAWGKGYATELTKRGLVYFFANTDKTDLFAITDVENDPSQKVLIKAGFTIERQTIENERTLTVFHIAKAAAS